MKPLFFTILFFKLCGFILAQDTKITIGSKSHAMAGSIFLLNDAPGIFNFPAAGVLSENSKAFFGYRNHFSLEELQLIYAGFSYVRDNFSGGVSILRFGDEFYNSNRISIIGSHQINSFALGIKLRRDEIFLTEYDALSAFSADLSGIYMLSEKLTIGMAVTNMSQSKLSKQVALPSTMTICINHQLSKSIFFIGEVEQEVGRPSLIRAACEFKPTKWLFLQAGLQPLNQIWSAGIAIESSRFSFQVGMQNSIRLGASNDFSLLYKFHKAK